MKNFGKQVYCQRFHKKFTGISQRMHAKCGGFNVSLIDAYAQSHVDLLNGTPPLWRGFHLENKTAAENKFNVIKLRSLK